MAPSIELTIADTTPAADPAKPDRAALKPAIGEAAAAERRYLTEAVIRPLVNFSLAQEATTAEERQRAAGLVGKIEAHNRSVRGRFAWWPF